MFLQDIVTESNKFDLVAFVPLLRERIYSNNQYARQFIISWVRPFLCFYLYAIDNIEHFWIPHQIHSQILWHDKPIIIKIAQHDIAKQVKKYILQSASVWFLNSSWSNCAYVMFTVSSVGNINIYII